MSGGSMNIEKNSNSNSNNISIDAPASSVTHEELRRSNELFIQEHVRINKSHCTLFCKKGEEVIGFPMSIEQIMEDLTKDFRSRPDDKGAFLNEIYISVQKYFGNIQTSDRDPIQTLTKTVIERSEIYQSSKDKDVLATLYSTVGEYRGIEDQAAAIINASKSIDGIHLDHGVSEYGSDIASGFNQNYDMWSRGFDAASTMLLSKMLVKPQGDILGIVVKSNSSRYCCCITIGSRIIGPDDCEVIGVMTVTNENGTMINDFSTNKKNSGLVIFPSVASISAKSCQNNNREIKFPPQIDSLSLGLLKTFADLAKGLQTIFYNLKGILIQLVTHDALLGAMMLSGVTPHITNLSTIMPKFFPLIMILAKTQPLRVDSKKKGNHFANNNRLLFVSSTIANNEEYSEEYKQYLESLRNWEELYEQILTEIKRMESVLNSNSRNFEIVDKIVSEYFEQYDSYFNLRQEGDFWISGRTSDKKEKLKNKTIMNLNMFCKENNIPTCSAQDEVETCVVKTKEILMQIRDEMIIPPLSNLHKNSEAIRNSKPKLFNGNKSISKSSYVGDMDDGDDADLFGKGDTIAGGESGEPSATYTVYGLGGRGGSMGGHGGPNGGSAMGGRGGSMGGRGGSAMEGRDFGGGKPPLKTRKNRKPRKTRKQRKTYRK